MKYLQLRLRFTAEMRHPMQRFIDQSEAVERDVLVHGNTIGDQDTFLFYVVGDREPYATALAAAEMITDFAITEIDDRSFYCFLTQRRNAVDEAMFDSLNRTGVIVVPPIEFLPDGVATLTVVGQAAALQDALSEIPEGVTVTVQEVGAYDWRQSVFDPGCTERQRAAVRAAVEAGYYAVPRESSIEAVADALDCAPSTAAEHLRKAEGAVMAEFCSLRQYG